MCSPSPGGLGCTWSIFVATWVSDSGNLHLGVNLTHGVDIHVDCLGIVRHGRLLYRISESDNGWSRGSKQTRDTSRQAEGRRSNICMFRCMHPCRTYPRRQICCPISTRRTSPVPVSRPQPICLGGSQTQAFVERHACPIEKGLTGAKSHGWWRVTGSD